MKITLNEEELMVRSKVFSSGGGTQSACIAAMICRGDIEKPDFACIADTGYERSTTWDYMEKYVTPALKYAGVEMVRVPSKKYATVGLYGGKNKDSLLIPAFSTESGEVGKMRTFCSNEWKKHVIRRWLTEQGVKSAEMWLGYSLEEKKRIRIEEGKWENRFPLIEKRFYRHDSIKYVLDYGWPEPPRSACYMCPNHSDSDWQWQKENSPIDHERAVLFQNRIRLVDQDVWLTRHAEPIENVDFSNADEDQIGFCEQWGCFT